MTYEEMVERAQRMRSRDIFGAVPPEEIDAVGAVQTELQLKVSEKHTVHIYQLEPKNGRPENSAMILNFHGGGFIKGRQTKDHLFCSQMAVDFNCLVWDVDYSLAPEYPYPTAVEESYAVAAYAFKHAQEYGVDATRIVLLGHSAGGNLVATVCLRAGETKEFQPAAIVMEFFPLDLATDPATKPRAEGDMPAEVARTYNAFYCPAELADTPYVSPIFATEAQLAGFPDTLIISAAKDSLCFEDEEFAMKLARAGVTTTCKRFQNSLHGFTINRNGDWEESQALLKQFVRKYIG